MKGVTYKGKRVLSGRMLTATHKAGISECYLELDNYGELEVSTSDYFAAIAELQRHAGEKPQGHQHAELMAQYAEDAKTNAEPWRLWEAKHMGVWMGFDDSFGFRSGTEYRRKPKVKIIHGVEVPDISFVPKDEDKYWLPLPLSINMVDWGVWGAHKEPAQHRSSNGLCYPYTEEGKQAAILHAKAMLGIK